MSIPKVIKMISVYCVYKIGKLKDLGILEIDREYPDLDCYKDFEVVERFTQVLHENGLIYDDLVYKHKIVIPIKV